MMEYYSAIKKIEPFATYSNMDGLGGPYAQWNKSDRKRNILYDNICEIKKYHKLVNIKKKEVGSQI